MRPGIQRQRGLVTSSARLAEMVVNWVVLAAGMEVAGAVGLEKAGEVEEREAATEVESARQEASGAVVEDAAGEEEAAAEEAEEEEEEDPEEMREAAATGVGLAELDRSAIWPLDPRSSASCPPSSTCIARIAPRPRHCHSERIGSDSLVGRRCTLNTFRPASEGSCPHERRGQMAGKAGYNGASHLAAKAVEEAVVAEVAVAVYAAARK